MDADPESRRNYYIHQNLLLMEAQLIRYRDAHLADYIWFWVIKHVRVSPIYESEELAKTWDGKPIELT